MALRLGVELVEKLQALIKIASNRMMPRRTFFERWFICLYPCLSILDIDIYRITILLFSGGTGSLKLTRERIRTLVRNMRVIHSYYNRNSPAASCNWGVLFSVPWGRHSFALIISLSLIQHRELWNGQTYLWIESSSGCWRSC